MKDIAIMSKKLLEYDVITEYSTVWMDTLRDGESELVNTNKLVRFYEGTTGLKTGTTSGAGYCLSATAERNGLELVAVIMSGETSGERFNSAKTLLNYGFANYEYATLLPELPQNELAVLGGVAKKVKITTNSNFSTLLKKGDVKNVTQSVVLNENITAPVKKDNILGCVEFYLGDEKIGQIDIVATETVDKLTFFTAFLWILDGLLK